VLRGVDGVDLHERVDELLGDPAALLVGLEAGGQRVGDDLPGQALHEEERRADHRLVVADGEHPRHPGLGVLQGAQQPRLADHVVRGLRDRRAWRAAQDDVGVAAAHHVGDVRVAVADGCGLEAARAEPVLVEEREQRLDDEQRRTVVGLRLGVRLDDVVRRGRDRHGRQPSPSHVPPPCRTATFDRARRF
jgi:hypothetical protein